ncbi:hypothetical protein [Fuerstiella marisgermanici]|uniref:Uncharacterized protein n=1 Tax=Fuerstiella marisgermanici TaxID=1891926 RepID=A0A1P8WA27_9PLAN|nr:hypothetical protein [Fuerstiella marisgermanici]APZ90902.1 hypothetical protein Fuma_00486 [Fuerstiella marisgermanici]
MIESFQPREFCPLCDRVARYLFSNLIVRLVVRHPAHPLVRKAAPRING